MNDQHSEILALSIHMPHRIDANAVTFCSRDGARALPQFEEELRLLLSRKTEVLQEEIAVLREQLNVATTRAQRFRDCLLRIAAKANDYTLSDIWANVADALEISVKELEAMVEGKE